MDIIGAIGIAVVLAYGGYLTRLELVSIGVIVAFLQYVRRFFEPVRALSMLWAQGAVGHRRRRAHLRAAGRGAAGRRTPPTPGRWRSPKAAWSCPA